MLGRFTPGENILIGERKAIIVRRHQWKRNVWYVNVPNSGYGWFDDDSITKIENIKTKVVSPRKQVMESNSIRREKSSRKGTTDFLTMGMRDLEG